MFNYLINDSTSNYNKNISYIRNIIYKLINKINIKKQINITASTTLSYLEINIQREQNLPNVKYKKRVHQLNPTQYFGY